MVKVKNRKSMSKQIGHVGDFWHPHATPSEENLAKWAEHDNGHSMATTIVGRVSRREDPFGPSADRKDDEGPEVRFVVSDRLEWDDAGEELIEKDLPALMCSNHANLNDQLEKVAPGSFVSITYTGTATTKSRRTVQTYEVEVLELGE